MADNLEICNSVKGNSTGGSEMNLLIFLFHSVEAAD